MGLESIFGKIGTVCEGIWNKGIETISNSVSYNQEAVVGVIIVIIILWYLFKGRK